VTNRWLISIVGLLCFGVPCAAKAEEGFAAAKPGYTWSFPRDHGAHPSYQTEWWYFTGQLYRSDAEIFKKAPRYGFQLTFFRRRAGGPGMQGDNYLAHSALSLLELSEPRFISTTKRTRGTLALAGAKENLMSVWNREWEVNQIGALHALSFDLEIDGTVHHIKLAGEPAREDIIFHGENGFSRKGGCDTCASLYYSLPRIRMKGHIEKEGRPEEVFGLAWMDHEFMSNALQETQAGWDWMGLMFKDGTNLMLFRVRGTDPAFDYYSGTLQNSAGTRALQKGEFSIKPTKTWKSSFSGAAYPIEWEIEVPAAQIKKTIKARMADQEVVDEEGLTYWEGAVSDGEEGMIGYLEMTGYAKALGKAF
jgi:predicted secreted hydrolase